MESCRKIFDEVNDINLHNRWTQQMSLYHPKGPNSVRVGIPQDYKWVKLVTCKQKKRWLRASVPQLPYLHTTSGSQNHKSLSGNRGEQRHG